MGELAVSRVDRAFLGWQLICKGRYRKDFRVGSSSEVALRGRVVLDELKLLGAIV